MSDNQWWLLRALYVACAVAAVGLLLHVVVTSVG
jgi:hypothetical protein